MDDTTAQSTPPKKYVRTFAGDMATLEKGGTPELAPLEPKLQTGRTELATAKDRLVAPSPIQETLLPASPELERGEPAPVAPAPSTPLLESAFRPVPAPPELARVETYASDFSERIKQEHASPMTVLAAEQDHAPVSAPAPPKSPSRVGGGLLYVIAGAVLVLAGGVGAAIAYVRYQTASAPVVLAPAVQAPIFIDDREEVSGTGAVLLQAIEQSNTRLLSLNTVRLLYTAPAVGAATDVFSQLNVSAPAVLLRNIDPAGSMAGIVNTGVVQSPFFILSVTTYGNTLAGMLSWETVMPSALAALYPTYPAPAAATTTVPAATSTPVTAAPAFVPSFKDENVANHDVRVYRDAAGRSIVLYGYWNQATLVIARDPRAFTEILERLATSRTR